MSVHSPSPPHNIWLQRFKRLAPVDCLLNPEDPASNCHDTTDKCDRDYRTDNHASFIETR